MTEKYPPCVHCGSCCSTAPCGYGSGVPCIHLHKVGDDWLCGLIDVIKRDMLMGVGAGCPRTLFNTVRDEKIRKDRER
jgi:hypothetical protein